MNSAAAAPGGAGPAATDQRSNGDMFRRGFAEGYQSGYDRYRGSNGGYGQPG